MVVRRLFFWWLIPAAFVLPLWMLVGWIVTGAGGWALLWVFFAIPGIFVWQVILTLLVRARGTVRAERAVSWWDVGAFAIWHALVIALGFFNPTWWAPLFVAAMAVGVGLLWLEFWQLWSEARPSRFVLRTTEGLGYIPAPAPEPARSTPDDIIVITESRERSAP
ncbi:MFS transporter permease [Microbacterium sp. SLBN-146]|uniref:MFS transporter permease n=1 Tax=Microbacterium sp. SLBN-146 TaxID=2768457 RepID=UPI001152843B|nr:MFS transporter permease [Microbacterium sp. SLBN-146]TQJ31932.1 hypothetical protein FBY39_2421 [Microbacterium sp. SLBN-146]